MGFGKERIFKNIIPDLRDNFPSKAAPKTVEKKLEHPQEAVLISERFFPEQIRDALMARMEESPVGRYKARVVVGDAEDGTRHPHDFVLDKDTDNLSLYFVDPEHQMGKSKNKAAIPLPRKGDLRPKIATLIAARIQKGQAVPDFSILRFRTEHIQDGHTLKMEPQLKLAERLLADGQVPELLDGLDRDITFRLNIRPDEMQIQSRYVNAQEMDDFLEGKDGPNALEGKVDSSAILMRRFLSLAEAGEFKRLDEAQDMPAAS